MLEVRVKKGRGCNAPMHFCTYAFLHLCIFASLHFACLHYCNSAFLHPCNVSESSEREERERYIIIYEKSGTSSYTKGAVHRQERYIIIYERVGKELRDTVGFVSFSKTLVLTAIRISSLPF